jgi:glycine cleavage system regulatory protein
LLIKQTPEQLTQQEVAYQSLSQLLIQQLTQRLIQQLTQLLSKHSSGICGLSSEVYKALILSVPPLLVDEIS